jgi:hypothetical protein
LENRLNTEWRQAMGSRIQEKVNKYRSLLVGGVVLLLIVVFLLNVIPLAYLNSNSMDEDQGKYLQIALWIANFQRLTDGNRNFLYSLLLSPFARPDISFFTTSKIISMLIGGLGLGWIFFIGRRMLGNAGAFFLIIFLAFNAEIRHSASIVHVEILLVPLFYLAWYAGAQCLMRDARSGAWWSIVAGVASGLFYLGKGSGILLLPIIAGTQVWLDGWKIFLSRKIYLILLGFLITAVPLWLYNTIQYGNPLFNLNTTHYMWLDTWEDSYVYSVDSLPTLGSYLRTHSVAEISERVWIGFRDKAPTQWYDALRLSFMPLHDRAVNWAMAAFAFVLLIVGGRAWQAWRARRVYFLLTLLGILLFALLQIWYHPISASARFVVFWTPVIYTGIIWTAQSLIPADRQPIYETVVFLGGLDIPHRRFFSQSPQSFTAARYGRRRSPRCPGFCRDDGHFAGEDCSRGCVSLRSDARTNPMVGF